MLLSGPAFKTGRQQVIEAGIYLWNKPIVIRASFYLVILRVYYDNKNRLYIEVHRTINNLDTKIHAIQ